MSVKIEIYCNESIGKPSIPDVIELSHDGTSITMEVVNIGDGVNSQNTKSYACIYPEDVKLLIRNLEAMLSFLDKE